MKCLLIIAFLLSGIQQQLPTVKQIEAQLQQDLVGKALILRRPLRSNHLDFASDGSAMGAPRRGTWAMDGAIVVDHIKLDDNKLIVEGTHLIRAYFDGTLKSDRVGDEVRIKIQLNSSDPVGSVRRLLPVIFLTTNEPEAAMPPPDLRNFQNDKFEHFTDSLYREKGTATWMPVRKIMELIAAGQLEDGEKVYLISGAVNPPKPLKTPDPKYPLSESKAKIEGDGSAMAVVDQYGMIHTVAVQEGNPAFQHAFLAALRQWAFTPATYNGSPIACLIRVEFHFRLR